MCQPKRNTETREHNKHNNKSTFSVFKSVEGEENPAASLWGKALAGWGFHSAAVPPTSSSEKEMCARKRK